MFLFVPPSGIKAEAFDWLGTSHRSMPRLPQGRETSDLSPFALVIKVRTLHLVNNTYLGELP